MDHAEWYTSLWNDKNKVNGNKLRTYRLFKDSVSVEPYLLLNMHRLQRRAYTMLRIGVLPLQIETGRYSRPSTPLEDRKCTLCNLDCIEDEKHFLQVCPLYSDLRTSILDSAYNTNNSFTDMSSEQQFTFLMSEPSLQIRMCKTISSMFDRRLVFVKK